MAKNDNKAEVDGFALRFRQLLDRLDVTAYQLAKGMGTSEAQISKVKNGVSYPNAEFFKRLLNYSQVININWLLTAKGKMFLPEGFLGTTFESGGTMRQLYVENDTKSEVSEAVEKMNLLKNDDDLMQELDDLKKQIDVIKQKIIKQKTSK